MSAVASVAVASAMGRSCAWMDRCCCCCERGDVMDVVAGSAVVVTDSAVSDVADHADNSEVDNQRPAARAPSTARATSE